MPFVGDDRRLEANERHNAAQKEVDLFEMLKLVECALAHQPVICVIVDNVDPQPLHYLVKSLGSELFKKGICFAGAAHSVDCLLYTSRCV